MHRIVLVTLAAPLLGSACRSDAQRVVREEATLLVARFDRMQASSGPPRARLLDELETTACSLPLACDFRSTCVEAYRALHTARDDLEEIRRRLDAPGTAGAPASSAVLRLADAEKRLEQSRADAARCIDLRGRLVRQQDVR